MRADSACVLPSFKLSSRKNSPHHASDTLRLLPSLSLPFLDLISSGKLPPSVMTNTAAGPLGGASQSAGPHTGSGSQDYNAELFSSILADHKYEIESRAFTAASLGPSPAPVEKPLPSFWLETSADPGPADGVFGTDAPLDSDVDVAIIG